MADNPYTSVSISGYNTNPPADDGSKVATNQLTWAKHKTKLSDPLKNLAVSINANVLAAFNKTINTDPDQSNPIAGSIAYTPLELTINSGSITVTRSSHTVDTELDAASDELVTIVNSGTAVGAILYLRAENSARVVTIQSGSGNIFLRNLNRALSVTHPTVLMRVGTNWHEIESSIFVNKKSQMSALPAASLAVYQSISVIFRATSGDKGGGSFLVTKTDISTEVANDTEGGIYVPFDSDPTGASGGFIRVFNGPAFVEWFGAIGDNTNDDSAAINGAFAACDAFSIDIVFPLGFEYKCLTAVVASGKFGINMLSPIIWHGSGGAALTVGKNTVNLMEFDAGRFFHLDVKRNVDSAWTDDTDTGIHIVNVSGVNFHIKRTQGFTNGVLLEGDGTTVVGHFAWNRITFHFMRNNKYNIRIRRTGAGSSGFCNENTLIGGSFMNRNQVASAQETWALYVEDATGPWNGNRIYDFAPELDWTRPGDGAVFPGGGFWYEGACFNNIHVGIRWESTTTFAKLEEGTELPLVGGNNRNNTFEIAYTDPAEIIFLDTTLTGTNLLTNLNDNIAQENRAQWDSGNLSRIAAHESGANINVKGLSFIQSTVDADPVRESVSAFLKPEYIVFDNGTRGIVFEIDTTISKKFIIRRDVVAGFPGRIAFNMRDSLNANLTTRSLLQTNVGVTDLTSQTWPNFVENGDSLLVHPDVIVTVGSSVKSLQVRLSAGTDNLKLKRISVSSIDGGPCNISSGLPGWQDNVRISRQLPTQGWYSAGEMIQNTNNAATQTIGWKANKDGWAESDTWVLSTAYVIDDIRFNGANVYICTTGGTSAGSGGPTGTGTGITDNTVIWDFVAPLVTFRAGPVMP